MMSLKERNLKMIERALLNQDGVKELRGYMMKKHGVLS